MQGNIPLQTYNTIKSILLILNFIIMKKIFMLITCCFMAIAVNAAELNIYASGLKSGDVNSEKKSGNRIFPKCSCYSSSCKHYAG